MDLQLLEADGICGKYTLATTCSQLNPRGSKQTDRVINSTACCEWSITASSLEEVLMSLETQVDGSSKAINIFNGVQTSVDGSDDGNRAPRLPRWTRHEILVLIQGKKVAENRVRRGRAVGSAFGSNPLEPKWASVSSYCKRHGVNRGPVQCRKRWSNLAGDYKRIKEWESSLVKGDAGSDSFWVMRNDLRREKKLPGFFDREVYDILDGREGDDVTETMRVKDTCDVKMDDNGGVVVSVAAAAEEEEEAIFDSGRIAPVDDDGLLSDFEQSGQKETVVVESIAKTISSPIPVSENRCESICRGRSDQANNDLDNHGCNRHLSHLPTHHPLIHGATNKKREAANTEKPSTSSHEGWKRRRSSSDEGGETSAQDQLVKVLERNGRMLTAQLESQNVNCQLDRDQRKDHTSSLVAVLSKLADALGKIADKL